MRKDMPIKPICILLLSATVLASNALAQFGFGNLELQVVAGKPAVFSDHPLASGKFLASNATLSIYQPEFNFSYNGSVDQLGKLIIRDLPAGLNNYEISWRDFQGDMWGAKGSVFIKRASMEKEFVELKWIGK
jgi:hypothetical protein